MKTPEEFIKEKTGAKFNTHNVWTDCEHVWVDVLKWLNEYAEHAVNEQREIMAKHLNLRNVPRPKINEQAKTHD